MTDTTPKALDNVPHLRAVPDLELQRLSSELDRSWRFEDCVTSVVREAPEILVGGLRAGEFRLSHAERYQDLHLATDYTATLVLPATTLALRVRRFEVLRRFGHEVVLRDSTKYGGPTEAEKVLTNPYSADYYLHAFADPEGVRFLQWVLLDLRRLRRCWADPDRRRLLGARRVTFGPGQHGLALDIEHLKVAQVVIRALLVKPTFYQLSEAIAFLSGNRVFDALDPQSQRVLARQFLTGSFQSTYYQGPQPLNHR